MFTSKPFQEKKRDVEQRLRFAEECGDPDLLAQVRQEVWGEWVVKGGPKKPVISRAIASPMGGYKLITPVTQFIRPFIGVVTPLLSLGSGPTLYANSHECVKAKHASSKICWSYFGGYFCW